MGFYGTIYIPYYERRGCIWRCLVDRLVDRLADRLAAQVAGRMGQAEATECLEPLRGEGDSAAASAAGHRVLA